MEYVPGISVQSQLTQGAALDRSACAVVRQAARPLGAAHAVGLIHRDVKPSNLLLTPSGTVKLLDLGIARWLEEEADASDPLLTQADDQIGTLDFMAPPEQWDDPRLVDARTDLYGLGCTLHALLTGKAPYASNTVRSRTGKRKAHIDSPIPDLRTLRPDAPDAPVRIHRRLLEKKPEDRFASAAELIEALRELAGARSRSSRRRPIPHASIPPTDRSTRPSKPVPHWIASTRVRLGLEFAVLAAVVSVLAGHPFERADEKRPPGTTRPPANSVPSELMLTPDELRGGSCRSAGR